MNSDIIVHPENGTDHSEHDPTDLLSESPVIGGIIAVFLGILCLLTVFGNAVVLHAIRTERRLQTVSNMFILSLAVADIAVGLVVMPISSAYVLTGKWRFGLVVCQFWLSADYLASTASILNLIVLSLDRYWSISRPLEYLRKRSKKRALIVITIVWLGSFLWIVPIVGWHKFFNEGVRKQPSDVCETEFADNVVFKLTISTINFYCPMLSMIVIYTRIYIQIRKRARSEVINRCSDIRPDSFSGNSDPSPSPVRYALATHNPKKGKNNQKHNQKNNQKNNQKKKQKKKKEENLEDDPAPEEFSPMEMQVAPGASSCNASCDGSVTAASDARWRCNVCGATQTKSEDWSWRQKQNTMSETTMMEFRSNLSDDFSSRNKHRRKNNFQTSRGEKTIDQDMISRVGNDINLQVPPSETHPPSRTSSLRILSGNSRGVRIVPPSRRTVVSLRQETKAARQLGVIIGAFVLCWLPYMVLFVVTAACNDCLAAGVHTAAIWLGYINSTINPVIYALCNASFKRAFWKIGTGVTSRWTRRCRRRSLELPPENNPFA